MEDNNKTMGIGGWLILSIIQLIIYFVMTTIMMFDNIAIYEVNGFLIMLVVMDGITIILSFLCLMLIFFKQKMAIGSVISFHVINIIFAIVIAVFANYYWDILSPLIVGTLWIAYYLKSERVKNTLVN